MEQKMDQVQKMEQEQTAEQLTEVETPVTAKKLYAKIRNILISMFALVFVTVMFYAASTWSYFTDGANSAQNKIMAGSLDMELIEMSDQGGVEVPFQNYVRIVPSLQVSKIVRIKNSGTLPMMVRVKIDVTIDKDESKLPDNWRSLITCNFDLDNEETGNVGTWMLGEDGYYYYILPLEAGKVTTPLFDTITFSSNMGNEFTNSKIEFTVYCEAIQTGADTWQTDAVTNGNDTSADSEPANNESTEADEMN